MKAASYVLGFFAIIGLGSIALLLMFVAMIVCLTILTPLFLVMSLTAKGRKERNRFIANILAGPDGGYFPDEEEGREWE
ncbi:hypothetical protein HYS03_02070 [Candidatus Woesebacteria bacterium]|nr:hypothetical protein [Candidatus Woesebacteria bacterium]QQG47742.1 MAG: hypothetical protein HY044_01475 [Candidatus Woesebacteria bacterium]